MFKKEKNKRVEGPPKPVRQKVKKPKKTKEEKQAAKEARKRRLKADKDMGLVVCCYLISEIEHLFFNTNCIYTDRKL